MALRATVSNGFRAPSLAQQSYQVITSNYANGVFVESGTFPATSVVAQALGSQPLQAETSTSYSLGLVLQPAERLYITVDAFQIDIDDRILLSSTINTNPAPRMLRLASERGKHYALHPVHRSDDAADRRPRQQARHDPRTGTFHLPARTALVYMLE